MAFRFLASLLMLAGWVAAQTSPDNLSDNSLANVNLEERDIPEPGAYGRHPITWNSSRYAVIATVTAIVVVAAGLVAVSAFILPLLTYKLCYIFGDCDQSFFYYVDRFVTEGDVRKSVQKRSLEYLGPVMEALSAAYEKYASPELKKNSATSTFYAR